MLAAAAGLQVADVAWASTTVGAAMTKTLMLIHGA